MLRVLAVDDEPSALSDLADRIRADARLKLVGTALSAREALDLVAARAPQALFLDVQMAGMSGLELAEAARDLKVVFVSAHSNHALDAFDLDAVDYLLKPIRQARFHEAVSRLVKAVALEAALLKARPARAESGTLLVTAGRDRQVIPARDIVAVLADGDYAQILPAHARPVLSALSLKQIAATLPDRTFLRLDRSTILNLRRLKSFRTVDKVKMRLVCDGLDGTMVIGRSAATTLRRHLSAMVGDG